MNSMSICFSLQGDSGSYRNAGRSKERQASRSSYTSLTSRTAYLLPPPPPPLCRSLPPLCRSPPLPPPSLSLPHSPVSSGGNEVEAAVDAMVLQSVPQHTTLGIQELLKLTVNVLRDRLPAAGERQGSISGVSVSLDPHTLCLGLVLAQPLVSLSVWIHTPSA